MPALPLQQAADYLALTLMAGAVATAFGAMAARSLFAMCMYIAVTGALVALALLALGARDAALVLTLLSAGVAPFVLLSAVLLSARTAKPMRRAAPWSVALGAVLVAVAALWAMPQGGAPPARLLPSPEIAFWLAPLVLVGALACFGLLGFGERGAFSHAPETDA